MADMDMEHTDVLEDILRRLSPRDIAVSRCVCKAWRATIHHHRLLGADLLPLSLDGVIYNIDKIAAPNLFACHSTTRYITSRLDYLDDRLGYAEVVGKITDYSNGLFLIESNKVVNPATRQWASLPRLPCACSWRVATCGRCYNNSYLLYDPTVSPHYKVYYIPRIPRCVSDDTARSEEWPPSPYFMHVFSSKTKCWKERSFIREGGAGGTMEDVRSSHWKSDEDLYYAAYWQGSLYVPSRDRQDGFLLRINLSDDTYEVINLPKGGIGSVFRIGKSKKGVYCVLDIDGRCTFQIWFLSESCGLIEWVLTNEINLEPAKREYPYDKHLDDGPWISQSPDQKEELLKNVVNVKLVDEYSEARTKDDFEWDSDDENVVSTMHWPKKCSHDYVNAPFFYCLGFHPYKEIALFHDSCSYTTIAYHLNSSKVRYLGRMDYDVHCKLDISFAYTPCWTMDLPGGN